MNQPQGDAISILMSEHHAVKERFQQMLQADGARRGEILEEIKQMLAVHNASEENVIYPAVHSMAQRPMHARTLYHEQDDAEIALWDLASLEPGDPEFVRKGSDLLDALLAHVKREEETEFRHLREDLAPDALAELTAEFHTFRAALARPGVNASY
jgi:hypothetical protein